MKNRAMAITMGDPAGVGAEIIVKALQKPLPGIDVVVIGSIDRLRLAAGCVRLNPTFVKIERPDQVAPGSAAIHCIDPGVPTQNIAFGVVDAAGGEAAYRYIEIACRMAMEGSVHAVVTAPLSKEALHAAGHIFPGHTEMLAHLSDTPEVSMMLMAPRLRVIHVTTHIGLRDAIDRIEPGLVERTIRRGEAALKKAGIAVPRIAVCGINPHAGENRLFGYDEEAQKIEPAIERCRKDGIEVQGPLPADTLFFRARRGDYDLVVAMYHDQGHGPVKVLGLESGVNVTVGLPFVRTSVDHGTAFDIAGKGIADELSLLEAMRQAIDMMPEAAGPRAP